MNKDLFTSSCAILACILFAINLTAQSQDIALVEKINVINSEVNNVIVDIDIIDRSQSVAGRINQNNVNNKEGFTSSVNPTTNRLNLQFTKPFNDQELYTLLEYCGIKLTLTPFQQLLSLVNQ